MVEKLKKSRDEEQLEMFEDLKTKGAWYINGRVRRWINKNIRRLKAKINSG